ncbi:uncharacterized protein LOC143459693 [Clavelina lepadiformis]|uniref:uncharacterized protein LOC143459693 n=1 Tax=Clavelina lepadiformis TaxID=159417 RepID=UPI0040434681
MKSIVVGLCMLMLVSSQRPQRQLDSSYCHYHDFLTTCPDDEFNCNCEKENSFELPPACISRTWVCDGQNDCPDGSDEWGCICQPGEFQCGCDEAGGTCPHLYQCIGSDKVCDGKPDCASLRDEYDVQCPNQTGETCTNGGYIDSAFRCNGIEICGDGSDERDCPPACGPFENRCDCFSEDGNNCKLNPCYAIYERCDGVANCEDGTDERDCDCAANNLTHCDCHQIGNYTCETVGVVCYNFSRDRCDGNLDCVDSSDEFNCSCPEERATPCDCNQPGNYTCRKEGAEKICYSQSAETCDQYSECTDGTDEKDCVCPQDHFTCNCFTETDPSCTRNVGCIPINRVNDGMFDCPDKEDEDFVKSLHIDQCDGVRIELFRFDDAAFCSPDFCNIATCSRALAFGCDLPDCVTYDVLCTSSGVGSKEITDRGQNCTKFFQCQDQSLLLSHRFCNGKVECGDGSDERIDRPGFKCSSNVSPNVCVLPQWNLYDDVAQCQDQSDLCFGEDGSFHCFQCLDKRLIVSASQVCDDVIDCYDLSDECLCANTDLTICSTVLAQVDSSTLQCRKNESACFTGITSLQLSDAICNDVSQCVGNIDESNCALGEPSTLCETKFGKVFAKHCDGRPECMDFSDECVGCPNPPAFCNDSCHSFYSLGDRYCDGYVDQAWFYINDSNCPRGFDEENCPQRFRCPSKDQISIDSMQVCDGVRDCDDGTDEDEERCPTRHYCDTEVGGKISIPQKFVLDGKRDCRDGSDEFRPGIFSSRYNLIGNIGLYVWFWIVAIVTLSGNIYVIILTALQLRKNEMNHGLKCNHVLILHLALSDFLMGVYLIIVVSKTAEFSGVYSAYDYSWRSGALCAAAGSLSLISSQTSVFMMAILTAFRLFSLLRPFHAQQASTRAWKIVAVCAWVVSLMLVILSNTLRYFKPIVLFPTLFSDVDHVSDEYVIDFACRVAGLTNSTVPASGNRWEYANRVLAEQSSQLPTPGDIGYYGTTSVCLPSFYVTAKDRYSGFSMTIITIDLLAFLFVLAGYATIWRRTTKRPTTQDPALNQIRKTQNRIARLIVTDFCCWMPICILVYLNFGGVKVSPEADIITAGLLLPINSALNPILYSPFVESFFETLTRRVKERSRRTKSVTTDNISMHTATTPGGQ